MDVENQIVINRKKQPFGMEYVAPLSWAEAKCKKGFFSGSFSLAQNLSSHCVALQFREDERHKTKEF